MIRKISVAASLVTLAVLGACGGGDDTAADTGFGMTTGAMATPPATTLPTTGMTTGTTTGTTTGADTTKTGTTKTP